MDKDHDGMVDMDELLKYEVGRQKAMLKAAEDAAAASASAAGLRLYIVARACIVLHMSFEWTRLFIRSNLNGHASNSSLSVPDYNMICCAYICWLVIIGI